MFVVVLIKDILSLKTKELSLAYSYNLHFFFVVGLMIDLVQIRCDCIELLFIVFLIGMVLCFIVDFCFSVKYQEKLPNEVTFRVNKLIVAKSPK